MFRGWLMIIYTPTPNLTREGWFIFLQDFRYWLWMKNDSHLRSGPMFAFHNLIQFKMWISGTLACTALHGASSRGCILYIFLWNGCVQCVLCSVAFSAQKFYFFYKQWTNVTRKGKEINHNKSLKIKSLNNNKSLTLHHLSQCSIFLFSSLTKLPHSARLATD